MENQIVPVGTSDAGMQMTGHYQSLADGYSSFGLSLPGFELPGVATSGDLEGFFTAAPVAGVTPGTAERGWAVGEIELGIRFRLFDTFAPWTPGSAEGPSTPGDTGSLPPDGGGSAGRAVRLRTTVGVRARIPVRTGTGPPLDDPADFLDLPIADGQPDLELGLYQDVAVGGFLYLALQARYGLQLSDERTLRIHSPDRRYAMVANEARLERNLGDYLWIRLSPQYRLTEVLSLGVEYTFWHKGSDRYRIAAGSALEPVTLELQTEQTRHRLGIGAFFRMGDARDRETRPWTFGFIYQTAIAGSGGRTPAAQLVTLTLRVPIGIF